MSSASSSTLILPETSTERSTVSESTISYSDLTTTEFSSLPPETTTELLTTTTLTIELPLTTVTEETSVSPFTTTNVFMPTDRLTTTEDNLSTFTLPPPILTTTESLRYSTTIPTTITYQTPSLSFTDPDLTSTVSALTSSTLQSEITTTTEEILIDTVTIPSPIITTTEFSTTEFPKPSLSSTGLPTDPPNLTTLQPSIELPSTTIPVTNPPPLLTTTPESQETSTQFTEPTTSLIQPNLTTLKTTSKIPSTSIPSTPLPTISAPPVTKPISSTVSVTTTCPPFPQICPTVVPINSTYFGDNAIDPRSSISRQISGDYCPCIDIRYAIAELLSRKASNGGSQKSQNRLNWSVFS